MTCTRLRFVTIYSLCTVLDIVVHFVAAEIAVAPESRVEDMDGSSGGKGRSCPLCPRPCPSPQLPFPHVPRFQGCPVSTCPAPLCSWLCPHTTKILAPLMIEDTRSDSNEKISVTIQPKEHILSLIEQMLFIVNEAGGDSLSASCQYERQFAVITQRSLATCTQSVMRHVC